MVSLQRFAEITIAIDGSLIHDSVRIWIRRIDFRAGNQHVVRGGIALPRDSSIRITRIDTDLGHLVDCLAVLHRQVIQEEEVVAVEVTHKSKIGSVAFIRTEVYDVLLERPIAPYAHGIHRAEGRDIIRILHYAHHDTTAVLTTGIGIDGSPEMDLTLVDMKVLIQRIRQCRRSQIDIAVGRNEGRRRTERTREDHGRGRIRRVVRTRITCSRRVDIRRYDSAGQVIAPSPIIIAILIGRIIEVLRERNLLGNAYAETERTILGLLATPCAILILADRTHIGQIELTRLQQEVYIRHITAYQFVVHDAVGVVLLDIGYHVRIDGVARDDHLKVIGIKAGAPEEVHTACALIEHHQVVGHRTLRRRLQLDLIQDDTMTQVIRSLESDLIVLPYFRQRNLHALPLRNRTAILA